MRARAQPLLCSTVTWPSGCNYQQAEARQPPPRHTPHHTMVINSKMEGASNLVWAMIGGSWSGATIPELCQLVLGDVARWHNLNV